MDSELISEVERISEKYKAMHDEVEQIWSRNMVFTWHWWLDVALAVLPWNCGL